MFSVQSVAAAPEFLAGTLEADQDQVINRALRAGVVIDSLDAKGLLSMNLEAPAGTYRLCTQAVDRK
jgi:hypothetical protein